MIRKYTTLIRKLFKVDARFEERTVAAILAAAMLLSVVPIDAYAAMATCAQQPESVHAGNTPGATSSKGSAKPVAHGNQSHRQNKSNTRQAAAAALPDSILLNGAVTRPSAVVEDEIEQTPSGRLEVAPVDTIDIDINRRHIEQQYPETATIFDTDSITAGERLAADSIPAIPAQPEEWVPREVEFTPDPTKAVWFAALFPGLGQVYNRRYWKLPIVVGGYMGLAYATTWNNGMLRDYTKAYADLLDNDPDTRSYMDLFGPNVKEENLDKDWLQNVINSRKNYFRRNRDLCIICMVAVYLVAMVDAYVDASLSHFDITPDLTMDVAPTLMQDGRGVKPSIGMMWALNF